jgi:SAM-dependent methyltransferase
MKEHSYRDYVGDAEHMRQYAEYQAKYAAQIRESDKRLIEMIRPLAAAGARTLIDFGCSTGNLLLHLKHALPEMKLRGADLVDAIIEANRKNAALSGIDFAVADMLQPDPQGATYDVVVANAALMFFDDAEFDRAVAMLARLVAPGGSFVAFDLFHPFEQEIALVERSQGHPAGLKFCFRSWKTVKRALEAAGLQPPELTMWNMPIDLPAPARPEDITSFTVPTTDGRRLSFRGALYQPWCHVSAKKA